MSDSAAVARPYARAIFEMAEAEAAFPQWSEMLELAAAITQHTDVMLLLGSPRITKLQMAEFFIDVAGERFSPTMRNFIHLLAENRRLNVLPDIAARYEILRMRAEGVVEASMVSAFPIEAAQREQVIGALKSRLGRDIRLQCSVDPALLGGAVIRAGDLVVDGSVTGKLKRLASAINH